jgi:hypothetical protein
MSNRSQIRRQIAAAIADADGLGLTGLDRQAFIAARYVHDPRDHYASRIWMEELRAAVRKARAARKDKPGSDPAQQELF